MIRKSHTVLWLGIGLSAGVSLGLASGVLADKPVATKPDLPWQDARMLAEVLERVKHDYVNPVDDHQLLQAAIRGMVSSLDPYSAYLDGDEYDEVKISSSGQYSGIGIEVSMEEEEVVVVSPFDGSPAAEAGIRPGVHGAATGRRVSVTGSRVLVWPGVWFSLRVPGSWMPARFSRSDWVPAGSP